MRAPSEKQIQDAIRAELTRRGWLVRRIACGALNTGFPDLWAAHPIHGQRWIEVKKPKGSRATPAQAKWFHRMESAGVGVYVLTSPAECDRLHESPNWREFYGSSDLRTV